MCHILSWNSGYDKVSEQGQDYIDHAAGQATRHACVFWETSETISEVIIVSKTRADLDQKGKEYHGIQISQKIADQDH